MNNVVRIVIAIVAVAAAAGGAYYYIVRQEVEVRVEAPPSAPAQGMSEEERLKAIKKGIGSIRELPSVTVPSGPPPRAKPARN